MILEYEGMEEVAQGWFPRFKIVGREGPKELPYPSTFVIFTKHRKCSFCDREIVEKGFRGLLVINEEWLGFCSLFCYDSFKKSSKLVAMLL